jgi:hypothetical protein
MSDEIDEKDLPPAGNSKAKLYPPVEHAEPGGQEEDVQQPPHGDAAAVREGAPEPNDAE